MPLFVSVILLVIAFILIASYMEWKCEKDKQRYSCYLKMMNKGFASASGCTGDGMPQCKHCYYYKIYSKRKKYDNIE